MSSYPTGLNLVMYLRKSRADQEAEARGEGETLAKHKRTLLSFAEKYRHHIVGTLEEIVSGERIVDRPEMQKLLHAVHERSFNGKRIDGVLVIDTDRFGRGNMIDQGIIHDAFKSSETLIVTPRKVYNTLDEFDEEYLEFESFMARRELKIITRRLQRGRKISAAEGKHVAKKPPYGYLRDENLKLYPDPVLGPIVTLIFKWAAEGLGSTRIIGRLYDMGIKSPSGNDLWERSSITAILRNEVYLGRIIWGQVRHRKISSGGYDRVRVTDRSQWAIKDDAHEALTDQETFDRAAEQSRSRNMPMHPGQELSNPLAGIAVCSHCGKTMRRRPRKQRNKNGFLCTTHKCPQKSALFELVEERFIAILNELLKEMQLQLEVPVRPDAGIEKEVIGSTISSLQKQLSDLKSQSSNIHDLLEKKVYTIEKFLERNEELESRIEKTKGMIADAQDRLANLIKSEQNQEEIVPRLAHVLENYNRCETAQQKNDLLKEVIEKVVYHREKSSKVLDDFSLEVFLKI